MTDTRTAEIRLGQAINLAMQFAFLDGAKDIASAIQAAEEALPEVLEFINKAQLKLAFDLEQTTPITSPEWQKAPEGWQVPAMPPPPPGAGAPPAPVPGVAQGGGSKTDALWQEYFRNPQAFYDNRHDKRNPAGPDFKHKKTGDGLWLNGKFPAPEWVHRQLAVQPF